MSIKLVLFGCALFAVCYFLFLRYLVFLGSNFSRREKFKKSVLGTAVGTVLVFLSLVQWL